MVELQEGEKIETKWQTLHETRDHSDHRACKSGNQNSHYGSRLCFSNLEQDVLYRRKSFFFCKESVLMIYYSKIKVSNFIRLYKSSVSNK